MFFCSLSVFFSTNSRRKHLSPSLLNAQLCSKASHYILPAIWCWPGSMESIYETFVAQKLSTAAEICVDESRVIGNQNKSWRTLKLHTESGGNSLWVHQCDALTNVITEVMKYNYPIHIHTVKNTLFILHLNSVYTVASHIILVVF